MSLIPNDEDRARQQGWLAGASAAQATIDALKARLAEEQERLDFLQGFLFTRRWMPPIGSPFTWELVGHWRHQIKDLKGETFRGAIDAARAADSAPAVLRCRSCGVPDGDGHSEHCTLPAVTAPAAQCSGPDGVCLQCGATQKSFAVSGCQYSADVVRK